MYVNCQVADFYVFSEFNIYVVRSNTQKCTRYPKNNNYGKIKRMKRIFLQIPFLHSSS